MKPSRLRRSILSNSTKVTAFLKIKRPFRLKVFPHKNLKVTWVVVLNLHCIAYPPWMKFHTHRGFLRQFWRRQTIIFYEKPLNVIWDGNFVNPSRNMGETNLYKLPQGYRKERILGNTFNAPQGYRGVSLKEKSSNYWVECFGIPLQAAK